jgi:hypothetical protein
MFYSCVLILFFILVQSGRLLLIVSPQRMKFINNYLKHDVLSASSGWLKLSVSSGRLKLSASSGQCKFWTVEVVCKFWMVEDVSCFEA